MINKDTEIEQFLQGRNDDIKYLVNIESNYFDNTVRLFLDIPEDGKKEVIDKYTPFSYVKDIGLMGLKLFDGDGKNIKKDRIKKYGIKYKTLDTYNNERLEAGYKYIFYGNSPYNLSKYFLEGKLSIVDTEKLKNYLIKYCGFVFDSDDEVVNNNYNNIYYRYLKDGDVDVKDEYLKPIYTIKPEEQYLIQKGIRLFKGIEKYDYLHRLQFDIETTGLDPETNRIFMIGIRDNYGKNVVLKVNKKDDDFSEKELIFDFFNTIYKINPSIITHYNGENFDWFFILKRCDILKFNLNSKFKKTVDGVSIEENRIITTNNKNITIRRADGTVKYGNDTERYTKTVIWGYSNIDILHAVKKTMAVNTEIKSAGLKYICKYEDIAKENRMYVKGDKIYNIWSENKNYIINRKNNEYKEIHKSYQDKPEIYLENLKDSILKEKREYKEPFNKENVDNIELITGEEIVNKYLIDDLWETEQVDLKYNESAFLLAKLLPTTFERVTTMGSAAVWKLIMTAWSYDNNIAIPISDDGDKFSGGLARAYNIGFSQNLKKLDFAGLYPSLQLTYNIFPTIDVTNALKRILLYLTNTRNTFKELSNDENLTKKERSFYKTKQLPLKILNNSLFGALGSGRSFPWGESIVSAQITCAGRLHLRKMINYFVGYNFKPILAVTDGVNFAIPDIVYKDINGNYVEDGININDIIYISGSKTYTGVEAIIENYNENIVKYSPNESRYIKVDDDGSFKSSLTVSRINYANLTYEEVDNKTGKIKPPKIKLTGNTIKSKIMPGYIEEFIDNGIKLILNNKPIEFVEYYYEYLDKIYYKQIPLKNIASKSRVKVMPSKYLERGLDKNGREKGKQAHMELIIKNNIHVELGDIIYYVNIGTSKSHGDTKIIKNKETGEEYMCSVLLNENDLESQDNINIDYNTRKYIGAFNERVKSLLLGFPENVRNTLLKDIKVNRKEKTKELGKREYYTDSELVLSNYTLDDYDESMYLEDLELDFWNKTGRNPNKIYDGFNLKNEADLEGVHDYDKTLEMLNEKRPANNKQLIKSIDDTHMEGDLVLKKYKDVFTIHEVVNDYLKQIHILK